MRYAKVIHPQADKNIGYGIPLLSDDHIEPLFQTANWNPFSEEQCDRVEFWANKNGEYTYAQAFKLAFNKTYQPVELQVFDDWYTAYERFCIETNTNQQSKQNCLDFMNCGDKFEHQLTYAHSVYNLTTKDYRSNTFAYQKNGHTWHLKVTHGELTDIYQQNVTIDDVNYEWVTYDLQTGNLFEYYIATEKDGFRINQKYLFANNKYEYPFYFVNSFDDIPSEQRVAIWDMSWKNNIVTWSQKPYGFIVEYQKQPFLEK